jgi:hypothetical protein
MGRVVAIKRCIGSSLRPRRTVTTFHGRRGSRDLLHQVGISAVELEKGRQLTTNLLANRLHRFRLVQRFVDRKQEFVEEAAVTPLADECAERAGRERRQIDRLDLGQDAAADERIEAGRFRCCERLRQQPQNEARQIRVTFFIAEPVGDERGEIDLAQFDFNRCRSRKCTSMNSPSLSAMRC